MKYLKHFNSLSEYNSFRESDAFIKPNVSHIKENNSVTFQSNKPKQITYQFDLRNIPWEQDWMTVGTMKKVITGDFSQLYDDIVNHLKEYGNKISYDDYVYYTLGDYGTEIPLENPKVSAIVDDYKTGEDKTCHLCWFETGVNEGWINWGFNNVGRGAHNGGGECELTRESFTLFDAVGF